MSLRTILVIAALYVLFLIGLTQVDAASNEKIKVSLLKKGPFAADMIFVLSARDVGTDKVAIVVNACGTVLEFTADKLALIQDDIEVVSFINAAIGKACK